MIKFQRGTSSPKHLRKGMSNSNTHNIHVTMHTKFIKNIFFYGDGGVGCTEVTYGQHLTITYISHF